MWNTALKAMLVTAMSTVATLGCAATSQSGAADPPATRQSMPGSRTPAAPGQTQNVSGKVQSFNIGPRGEVEGVMLSVDGKTAQLNFPPGLGEAVKATVAVGDTVKASVREPHGGLRLGMQGPGMRGTWMREWGGRDGPGAHRGPGGPGAPVPEMGRGPELPKPDHAVYETESLTDAKGKTYSVPRPGDGKAVHVEGKVAAINYDRGGMANGAQLESGDLIRLNPQEAKVLGLAVGSKLTVDGIAEPTIAGGRSIDAHTVNGILVKALGGEEHGGRPGMRGPGGGGDDRDGKRDR